MPRIPNLKELVLRDTPFAELMTRRIYNVLLIATKYDAFMLEEDGRVDEQIFNEYNQLGLRYPPRFTQVTSEQEARAQLEARHFELIIVMPNLDEEDTFASARRIKRQFPGTTMVVLTPFSSEVTRRFEHEDLTGIDYVFSWLGDAELLLAIIKLIEDSRNVEHDMQAAGVQAILLVEDSVRFYSATLPHLFRYVLEQSRNFSEEALNDQLRTMRMRGRPKIVLARSYEEAMARFEAFGENILGIITDMSFMREGRKDPLAGLRFCRAVRETNRHVPLIIDSSEEANRRYADEVGASFVSKLSKTFAHDLHAEINEHFGFGDFVIIDPATRRPIMRLHSLHDLQAAIWHIPEASLRYHLERNHFSRFLFSRAMFPPAVLLRRVDVDDYANAAEARQFIFDLIVSYRRLKNEGVVAVYQRGRFDEYASFARIGHGSLGGKGRGLAFMAAMVRRYPKLETEDFSVNIPKTVVLCTDIFDDFMESNDLYGVALGDAPDEEILARFEKGTLPAYVREDLLSLLDVVHGPIAVRSSSLLEDAHYQPFAGVYATYMIPPTPDRTEMLRRLKSAIKAVYASAFYRASKTYLTATQNLIDQEKMAVVLQEVVGEAHGARRFYPTLSGVARSLNCYPIAPEKADEGVANIALGLGKHIVDGGRTLRFSPRHTQHIMQLSELKLALAETQRTFAALDLENAVESFSVSDSFNVLTCTLGDAEADGTLQALCSTYDANDDVLRPGYLPQGRKVLTFQRLLQYAGFPLAGTIDRLLRIGRKEMGRHVEIEFAMQLHGTKADFYLLQIRPVVDEKFDVKVTADADGELLLRSEKVLGNGLLTDVDHVLYVRPERFSASDNPATARDVSQLNARFAATGAGGYLLIGPGRWGSSDPWLGIPVKWTDVSAARVIVECGREDYHVDPSQGTHFFQNLTSLGVGYVTVNPPRGDGFFDVSLLDRLPTVAETDRVRLVRLPRPMTVVMDGRHGRGEVRL